MRAFRPTRHAGASHKKIYLLYSPETSFFNRYHFEIIEKCLRKIIPRHLGRSFFSSFNSMKTAFFPKYARVIIAFAMISGVPFQASAALTFSATSVLSDGVLTIDPTTSLMLGGSAADVLTLQGTMSGASPLLFEGATADDFELTVAVTDPTADRTITLPNVTGTVVTTGNLTDITTTGTVSVGTWQGTAIAVANGGTGATTAGDARTNLGLGSIATQAANNVAITGGVITGVSGLLTSTLTDNTTNALDLQESTNNYININTTNSAENIAFGNGTTNPSFSFVGSGALTVAGSADGTDALIVTAGDLLLSNGDFDISGGDLNVVLDAGDGVNIGKGAAPTTNVVSIDGGTSATDEVVALTVGMTIDDASGTIIAAVDPIFIDNNSDNANEEWIVITTGDVAVTQNDSGGAVTGIVNGLDVGTLTETATGNDAITSSAIAIRNGWDRDIAFGNGDAALLYDESASKVRLEVIGNGSLFVEDTLGLGRQTKTITDDGTANDTLNPVNSYVELSQDATANGGTPNLVIGTASTVQEGDILVIVRVDSNAGDVTINEQGALKQNGNITLNSGAFDSVMYIYDGDNYVQIGGSDNGT